MDWMTLTITSIGVIIFCVWLVIPIQEFSKILRRLRSGGRLGTDQSERRE
ncbi:MAG TPA: hypothetical protein VL282_18060 [Tepidisphaeraceae bacterium]|jgi:hypothetical protein|nr:hypothetical protein [Tepidisphaeraceae bacterium]